MAFVGIAKSSMEEDLLRVSAECSLRGLTNTVKWYVFNPYSSTDACVIKVIFIYKKYR